MRIIRIAASVPFAMLACWCAALGGTFEMVADGLWAAANWIGRGRKETR